VKELGNVLCWFLTVSVCLHSTSRCFTVSGTAGTPQVMHLVCFSLLIKYLCVCRVYPILRHVMITYSFPVKLLVFFQRTVVSLIYHNVYHNVYLMNRDSLNKKIILIFIYIYSKNNELFNGY